MSSQFHITITWLRVDFKILIKAALINISTLTMDQMTMCNVKEVARSDEHTEDYHPTLQLPSALMSFSSFWFSFCLVRSHSSHQHCFLQQQAAGFSKKALINPPYTACSAAFRSYTARYFSQELVETQTELKGEWILDLQWKNSIHSI